MSLAPGAVGLVLEAMRPPMRVADSASSVPAGTVVGVGGGVGGGGVGEGGGVGTVTVGHMSM